MVGQNNTLRIWDYDPVIMLLSAFHIPPRGLLSWSNLLHRQLGVDTKFWIPYNMGPHSDVEILRPKVGLEPNQILNWIEKC